MLTRGHISSAPPLCQGAHICLCFFSCACTNALLWVTEMWWCLLGFTVVFIQIFTSITLTSCVYSHFFFVALEITFPFLWCSHIPGCMLTEITRASGIAELPDTQSRITWIMLNACRTLGIWTYGHSFTSEAFWVTPIFLKA